MVLALKLISAGVSYQDGLRKSEVISLTDMSPLSHENLQPGYLKNVSRKPAARLKDA